MNNVAHNDMKRYTLLYILFIFLSATLSLKAIDRGNLDFTDHGAKVRWRCDTGLDKQEKFRLRDVDLSGDYWRYFNTEDGVGTVTREHPYVDFTVRLYRNPEDNICEENHSGKIESCPRYAEVFLTGDNNIRYRLGELQHDGWSENTNWYFKPDNDANDAGMIAVIGHDGEGRVRLQYFPSASMLRDSKQFSIEFSRRETFYDGGFLSSGFFADWDHLDFTISRSYNIDYQQQLVPMSTFFKPGQMRFEVTGTYNECRDFETDWKDAYQKIEREKTYRVTVTNLTTNKQSEVSVLRYDADHKSVILDLPDYEQSAAGYTVSWTLTDRLQLTTRDNHVAGWNYEQKQSHELHPVVYPRELKAEFNQVSRTSKVYWTDGQGGGNYDKEDQYYIYRRQALNAMGDAGNTDKWKLVTTVKVQNEANHQYVIFDHNKLDYRKYYTYRVLYVPASWVKNGYKMPGEVEDTAETPTDGAQHFTMSSEPHVEIIDFAQDATVLDNITLSWTYSELPTTDKQVEFTVYRKHGDDEASWQQLGDRISVPAQAKEDRRPKIVDKDASSCEVYQYKLEISLADSTFESESLRATLLDKSRVTEVIAEKGANEGSVLIRWKGHQVGTSETEYLVERRPVTSNNEQDWVEVCKQRGTGTSYSYTDERCQAGEYYDYRVSAYTPACGTDVINDALPRRERRRMAAEQEYVFSNSLTDLGFGISRGVITGRVAYGTGTGVDSVRINLQANDEGLEGTFVQHSKYMGSDSEGIYWQESKPNLEQMFGLDRNVTLQLWVMPTEGNESTGSTPSHDTRSIHLATLPYKGDIYADLPLNQWSQVTVRISEDKAVINVNGDLQHPTQRKLNTNQGNNRVSIGNSNFTGYLRDVRIWGRELPNAEIESNWGRMLTGQEKDLILYWPLDEGVPGYAFDISKKAGLYNQRHGKSDATVTDSEVVPSNDLLALYGLTDTNGDYIIRGIPFIGEGTSYSLMPTKGIHKFDYPSRVVNIGREALAQSNVNFVDQSSFTYRGTVRYANTTIPVDSIQFAIDGVPVTKDSKEYLTGPSGEFEISVPIGDHYITASRNFHATTRFPETGTYTFLEEGTLNLYDSTLVNVAGRINGGPDGLKAPIGFKQLQNLLGPATITLALDKETENQFNMTYDPMKGFVPKGERTEIGSQDQDIVSENYYPANEPTQICIVTNEANGEFSAMLPPLRYKVLSIKFPTGSDYNNESFFSTDLPYIDATMPQTSIPDTLRTEDDQLMQYKCQGRMVLGYRSKPEIEVNQIGLPAGAFGITEVLKDPDDENSGISALKLDKDGNFESYRFSQYPIFQQDVKYTFMVNVKEKYKNSKDNVVRSCPVSDGSLHIVNNMSIKTIVCDGMTGIDQGYKPGDVIHASTVDIELDQEGRAGYSWCCGDPNLAGDHTRTLSIALNSNNRLYNWREEGLKAVVLGDILTGTGFATKAPDEVFYVMRDPGGASSNFTLQDDTIRVGTHTYAWTAGATLGNPASVTLKTGAELRNTRQQILVDPVTGTGVFNEGKMDTDHTLELTIGGIKGQGSVLLYDSYSSWSISTSQKLTTGTGGKHIGRSGDSFLGTSTNLFYGKGQRVLLKPTSNDMYTVDMTEDVVGKRTISTLFFFSEYYIIKQLIPAWETIRNSILIYSNQIPTELPAGLKDTTLYYSKVPPSDKSFGQPNTYTAVSDRALLSDSIASINLYIQRWKDVLGENERAKVLAMRDKSKYLIENLSFSGGNTYNYTHVSDSVLVNDTTKEWKFQGSFKLSKNNLVQGNGIILNLVDATASTSLKWKDTSKRTWRRTTSYTLSDPNRDAALSIDVYNDPTGQGGPIFLTRGGQTRAPWEDGSKVEYCKDYMNVVLDEPTMKIEKCNLIVDHPIVADLPSGDPAYFDLKVVNESETGTTSSYSIQLDNEDEFGASITIDGKPVVDYTSTWLLPPGSHTKRLVLTPTDPSITRYHIKLRVTATDDDVNIYSDWQELTATYQSTSAAVDLQLDHDVVNSNKNRTIQAKITGLNRQFKGLKGVRLLYCRQGSDQWITEHGWVVDSLKAQYGDLYETLPASGDITYNLSFVDDGTYFVKAQSFAEYGSGDVTRDSEERQIIQDTYAPRLLSDPYPADGIITLANVDDVSVTFNEDIAQNKLSKVENFNIVGYQNNISTQAADAGVPQTALQLNGTQVKTATRYDFSNRDLSYEFRYYRQSDGEIIGVGTMVNGVRLGTKDNGMLYIRVGEEEILTTLQIPSEQWCHLSLHYKPEADKNQGILSVGFASNGAAEQQLPIQEKVVKLTKANGLLTLGATGTVGRMSQLSLWSDGRTVTDCYASKDVIHSSSDEGIEGNWLLDEGHGTMLNDRARSNTMMVNEYGWYLANKNLAAYFDGKKPMKVSSASEAFAKDDNYLLEFWFHAQKGDDSNSNLNRYSTLVNTTSGMSIGFYAGNLTCTTYKNTEVPNAEEAYKQQLTANATIDNNWHHFALAVKRGISATFYLDGILMCNIPESKIPAIAGSYIYLGGQLKDLNESYDHLFQGDIDEFRLWRADRSKEVIDDERYERLTINPDSTLTGLVLYYPMESTKANPNTGMVETKLDLSCQVSRLNPMPEDNDHITQSETAPPLKVSKALLRLDETQYDIVTNERNIYLKFKKDMYAKMNGNAYTFTIKAVNDEYGNEAAPITWQSEFDLASVNWSMSETSCSSVSGQETVEMLHLYNRTAFEQIITLSGLPSWLEVSPSLVFLSGNSWENIDLHIKANAPVGNNTVTIYATDANQIAVPLTLHIEVLGDIPDWSVDASQYSNVMNIIGQIYIEGHRSTNSQSMVAAFDAQGNCRGVARPTFVESRNAYYVECSIYGENGETLTFRLYDADRNLLYTDISFELDGQTQRTSMKFNPNGFFGSYETPALFLSSANVLQTLALHTGWNWVSSFVKPGRAAISNVFANYTDDLSIIKGKSGYSMPATGADGQTTWTGSLAKIESGKMYSIKANNDVDVVLRGELTNVARTNIHLDKGWSWIGSTSHYTIGLNEAFGKNNADPQPDDVIKSQTAFAVYFDNKWSGTLTNIIPGQGYKYYSNASAAKEFTLPDVSGYASAPARDDQAQRAAQRGAKAEGKEINDGEYSDNMSIVLQLQESGQPVLDANVAAYIDQTLRGQISVIDGLYFLTVAGNADEFGLDITLHIDWSGGELSFTLPDITYRSDIVVGTPAEPYIIDLDQLPAAIADIDADRSEVPTYDLFGRRQRDNSNGFRIIGGQAQLLK